MMNKEELIKYINNNFNNKAITVAFEKIDRGDFVLDKYKNEAYGDYPLGIGFDQTISQPSVVAFMLNFLELKKEDKVLEVGSGSGFVVALLSQIVKKVFGVEIIPELVLFSKNNLKKYQLKNVKIFKANKKIGLEKEAPFDKILVSASANEIPKDLVSQLKDGGIMVIPVLNDIYKVIKKDSKLEVMKFEGFTFVPLK